VLIDRALLHRAQNGDVVVATPRVPAQAPPAAVPLPAARQADDPDPSEA
jgi:chorismate synthase